jgi:hypothetical protein
MRLSSSDSRLLINYRRKNVFTYYMHSLHRHHEQNVMLAKKASDACLEIAATVSDGQYQMAMGILHPILNQEPNTDLLAAWGPTIESSHQQLVFAEWFKNYRLKVEQLQHVLYTMMDHQATGWNSLAKEFMTKAQGDSSPEIQPVFHLAEAAMSQIASAESATIQAVEHMTQAPKIKPVPKRRSSKSAVAQGAKQ